MGLVGSSWFTVSDRPTLSREGPEAGPIVVWLWGEHDLSTDDTLCATLARAIAVDSPGLVLDLSEVEFMAASTLGVIARAQELLRQRSRSLMVRRSSRVVRRVIDVCGMTDLLEPNPQRSGEKPMRALGTWVAVAAVPWRDPGTAAPTGVPEYV
jgi:anti-anti-sigma factor